MPGNSLQNSIMLSDGEDETGERGNRQTSNSRPRVPSYPNSTTTAAPPETQSRRSSFFEGCRARVCWGTRVRSDDIIPLSGFSDSNTLIRRIETYKTKRHPIRNDSIAAADVQFDGGACFRIPWTDAFPAFEELQDLVESADGGQKLDLRLEIEWEYDEEGNLVKIERLET